MNAAIYRLPRWHAYVLGLGPRPAVVRFTPGYRIAQRQARTAIIGSDNRGPYGVPPNSQAGHTPTVKHQHARAHEQEAA